MIELEIIIKFHKSGSDYEQWCKTDFDTSEFAFNLLMENAKKTLERKARQQYDEPIKKEFN